MLLDIYLGFFLWMLLLLFFAACFVLVLNSSISSYLVHSLALTMSCMHALCDI